MSTNFDDWNDVSSSSNEKLPMWNPCTYKDADGETIKKKQSDNSYVIGYYLGMEVFSNKDGKQVTKHKLQLVKVGDKNDIEVSADMEFPQKGDVINMWGKTALDETLTTKVAEGQLVAIFWKGRVKSKRNPSMSYHSFEVKTKDEYLDAPKKEQVNKPAPTAPANEPFDDLSDEDDLDF